jgi:hypothetical protein
MAPIVRCYFHDKKNLAEEYRQVLFTLPKGVPPFSYGGPTPLTPNGNFFRYLCKFFISRRFSGNFFRYLLLNSPKQAFGPGFEGVNGNFFR